MALHLPVLRKLAVAVIASLVIGGGAALAETITGTTSVIDGDTIEIRGQRIRLHAIDRGIAFGKRCDDRWSCGRG